MKLNFVVLFLPFFLLGCATTSLKYDIPEHQQVTLSNGMNVYLIPDHSLPYFSMVMLVKSGSAQDPANQPGLAHSVASLLDKGTEDRSATEIAESLGQMGASFSASVSNDFTLVQGQSLSMHRDKFMDDFFEVLTQPAFSKKEVARFKKKWTAQLKGRVDAPRQITSVAMKKYIFSDHPYGQPASGTLKGAQNLTRSAVVNFYRKNYRPNHTSMAVVGDFDPKTIKSRLEKELSHWKKQKVDVEEVAEPENVKGLELQLVHKPDLKQTQIQMGQVGIAKSSPDIFPMKVAFRILGGSFNSRLMNEIRKERGLTYSIYSGMSPKKQKGPFLVSTFTRHGKVQETLQATLNELEKFIKEGVTQEELKNAKAQIQGQFPRTVETPESLAQNLLVLDYYGVGKDYLKNYLKAVDDVSVSDVNEAVRKHMSVKDLRILVYGPQKAVLDAVKKVDKKPEIKSYQEFL